MPDNILSTAVIDRINDLGDKAADYFGVTPGLIAQWVKGSRPVSIAAAEKVYAEAMEERAKQPALPQIAGEKEDPALTGKESMTLLLPTYDQIEPLHRISLDRCMKLFGMDKISMIPEERTLIDEARNTLAQKARAMNPRPKYVVMIDSDMVLPCGHGGMLKKMGVNMGKGYPEPKASRNALVRIMSHPPEARIVGCLYRNRRGSFKPAVELAYRSSSEDARLRNMFDPEFKGARSDGLEETGWVGGGMFRVEMSVFDEMAEASKNDGPLADIAPPAGREADAFGWFGRTSQWRGEDIAFCLRAQKIGIKTYVDTGLLCGHVFKGVI